MPRLVSVIRTTAFALLIALVSFSNSALADTVVLSGTHSKSDILQSCVGAGGSFSSGSGGYSCTTEKGSVNCNNSGKCVGNCESCGASNVKQKGPRGTPQGVLSGTTLKAGSTTPPKQGQASTHFPIMTKPIENHPTSERNGNGRR